MIRTITIVACLATATCAIWAKGAIDIDTGRQLFVDDYLVESTDGVVRHWNKPVKMEDPVVWPESGACGQGSAFLVPSEVRDTLFVLGFADGSWRVARLRGGWRPCLQGASRHAAGRCPRGERALARLYLQG